MWMNVVGQAIPGSAPFLSGAAMGAAAGSVVPGVGTMVGAMLGGGLAAAGQTLGNEYAAAREKGLSHDASVEHAMEAAASTGVINAATLPLAEFRVLKGAISNALAQAFVVQPAAGVADQAAQNAIARENYDPDRPLTSGLLESGVGKALFEGPGTVAEVAAMRRHGGNGTAAEKNVAVPAAPASPQTQPVETTPPLDGKPPLDLAALPPPPDRLSAERRSAKLGSAT